MNNHCWQCFSTLICFSLCCQPYLRFWQCSWDILIQCCYPLIFTIISINFLTTFPHSSLSQSPSPYDHPKEYWKIRPYPPPSPWFLIKFLPKPTISFKFLLQLLNLEISSCANSKFHQSFSISFLSLLLYNLSLFDLLLVRLFRPI